MVDFYRGSQEKVFSKGIVLILLAAMCLISLQFFIDFLGAKITPIWAILPLLLLFAVMINFWDLSIKITSQSIVVGYGIFKHIITWENIENCYLDETSAIRYGGWGIRMGRVKGKWRTVYNVIGGPRVVLSLRNGRVFKEFVSFN